MNSWTNENYLEKAVNGEMTEDDRDDLAYQYFAKQDSGNLDTVEVLFKAAYERASFDSTKKMIIKAYQRRHAEITLARKEPT